MLTGLILLAPSVPWFPCQLWSKKDNSKLELSLVTNTIWGNKSFYFVYTTVEYRFAKRVVNH